jgi:C1A family cysteine protease
MKVASLILASALAYDAEWEEFQAKNGYRNGEIPQAFKDTVDLVKAHNAGDSKYKLTYTGPFAAMTAEEFRQRQGFRQEQFQPEMPMQEVHVSLGDAPAEVDWSTKGVVTPIKDQGQCGSCWSFSVTGTTEGQWAMATNKLVSLSEQFFLSCSTQAGVNSGCSGGYMDKTLAWAQTQWLPTEESYPYHTAVRPCIEGGWDVGISKGQVTGYKTVPDEKALLDAVANVGPVSIAIEADQAAFQHYDSGVITDGCGQNTDHGVIVVGYGNMDGTDYWKVKNSWGESWGQKGYVFLERGVNMCAIGTQNWYPTVDPNVAPTPAPPAPPPTPTPTCDFGTDPKWGCTLNCFSWCQKQPNKGSQTPKCDDTDGHMDCECGDGNFCEKDDATAFEV